MLYNYKEAIKIYKNNYNLIKAIKAKKIFKIDTGIYSDKKNNFTIYELFLKKYPNSFLVKDSALFYIGFLSEEPEKIHLGTNRNSLRIKNPKIKQHFYKTYNDDTINSKYYSFTRLLCQKNITTYITENQNQIRILNFYALLYDLIRNQSKIDSVKFTKIIEKFKNSSLLIDFNLENFKNNLNHEKIYDYDYKLLLELEDISWNNEFKRDFY